MSNWPQPGDRVECVRAQSKLPSCRGRLKKGEVYTVAAREDTDWIKGIRLKEVPTTGAAPFAVSRFVRAILAGETET